MPPGDEQNKKRRKKSLKKFPCPPACALATLSAGLCSGFLHHGYVVIEEGAAWYNMVGVPSMRGGSPIAKWWKKV